MTACALPILERTVATVDENAPGLTTAQVSVDRCRGIVAARLNAGNGQPLATVVVARQGEQLIINGRRYPYPADAMANLGVRLAADGRLDRSDGEDIVYAAKQMRGIAASLDPRRRF